MDPPNRYLELLAAVGVHVDPEEWQQVHLNPLEHLDDATRDPLEWEAPQLPSEPTGRDEDGFPIFTRSQFDECAPEVFGYDEYTIVEDADAAHPFQASYEQELDWKRYHRPIHRYDRSYRIRWTLAHIVGCAGWAPRTVLHRLRETIRSDDLMSRRIYERVRLWLKQTRHVRLYAAIPYIIGQLGGPRWRISTEQYRKVLLDATLLHRLFDTFKQQARLGYRKRFPKIHFVLLRLLDRHGVWAPYRMAWARTLIKTQQLWTLLRTMETQPTHPSPTECQTASNANATQPTSERQTDLSSEHIPISAHSSSSSRNTTLCKSIKDATNTSLTTCTWTPDWRTTTKTDGSDSIPCVSFSTGPLPRCVDSPGTVVNSRSARGSIGNTPISKPASVEKRHRRPSQRRNVSWRNAAARFARSTVGPYGSSRHRMFDSWIRSTTIVA